MENLEDKIAKLCLDKYASLKKTGKPSENEWTVLSGVVLENIIKDLSVVSLCTGTKCLSGIELKNTAFKECGNKLSDSHAEILARRGFLRYLYNQIELLFDNQNSEIFYLSEKNIEIKDVAFHFFSSQTPCGDCSIIPKVENFNPVISSSKRLKLDNSNENESEIGLEITDVYRTGAKCIQTDLRQDPYQKGMLYHTVGPLRTKPGRGDRTLSLSCSDKIAKWNVVGVQGALLSLMIPPIRFKSIIIGGNCPYSLQSMQRGIYERFDCTIEAPQITQSKLFFNEIKGGLRVRPSPSSIVWCAVSEKQSEIAVNGLKQGATKKKNKSCNLLISRKELFKTFLKVFEKYSSDKKFPTHPKKITYYHYKQYSSAYQKLWKEKFKIWPVKPLYLQECLSF